MALPRHNACALGVGLALMVFLAALGVPTVTLGQPSAATPLYYSPQVPIPGTSEQAKAIASRQPVTANLLGQYVVAIYRFGIWLSIFLTIFMMMVGGFLWTIAGGNPSRVENAKSYITSALTGLVVALTSFVLLQTVNPRLVELSIPQPTKIIGEKLTARALRSTAVRSAQDLCHPGLRVPDRDRCNEACLQLGLGGALFKDLPPSLLPQPIAPEIPSLEADVPQEYCCACANRPCLDVFKKCSRESGATCCPPLSCYIDESSPDLPTNVVCRPLKAGGTEYRYAIRCDYDEYCLSGLCYDGFLSANYCVPVELFPDNHDCNRLQECKSQVCLAQVSTTAGALGTCITPRSLAQGAPCWDNIQCRSNACDTAAGKCL